MSDERIAKLEQTVESLRKQVRLMSMDQHDTRLTLARAVLAAVAVLFVGTVEPSGMLEADEYDTAPGRWLTLVAPLALAAVHGARANQLR